MKRSYLEVTFRKGKPLAAYIYLPRAAGVKSARTETAGPGLLVDFSRQDEPIGIEITAPGTVRLDEINQIMKKFGLPELGPEELAPLRAA